MAARHSRENTPDTGSRGGRGGSFADSDSTQRRQSSQQSPTGRQAPQQARKQPTTRQQTPAGALPRQQTPTRRQASRLPDPGLADHRLPDPKPINNKQATAQAAQQAAQTRRAQMAARKNTAKAKQRSIRAVRTRDAAERREGLSRGEMLKRSGRSLLTPIIAIVCLVVLSGTAFFLGLPKLQALFKPPEFVSGVEVEVYIPEGSSARQIAQTLKDKGVIADASEFLSVCRSLAVTDSLKPGRYHLVSGMPLDELAALLVAGPPDNSNRLTIPEGFTVEQTAARVEEACGISAESFLAEANNAAKYEADYSFLKGCYNNSLEGFLYPKTYQIPLGADAQYVVRTLLNQFSIETQGIDWGFAESRGLSAYDVVVMGSLIERETAIPEERELVASVIYNRLRNGTALQIDATIVYALNDSERNYSERPLLYSDLEVNSPYNTYKNVGLPPGPICSPRALSIQAAAKPADTSYYYYVLTSLEGYHTFCTTLEEFNAAQAEYRRVFGLD